MSEKRYMLSDFDSEVEMLEKLNELSDENEELQKRLQQIVENYNMTLKLDKKVYNKIRRLEKENMQLRQEKSYNEVI